MALAHNPSIVTNGLVLCLDAANRKGISPLGNNSFNGAEDLTRNLVSTGSNIQSLNGVNIGNLDYYTIFAISWRESEFGGDAAGRHGITPGFDVRSGTKLYNAGRALNFWVWNPDTSDWLPNSFFNGSREDGHCYDSWTGNSSWPQEVAQFVTDYNNIKSQFPNATYIMVGSHRDSGHTSDKFNVLMDVGAPSNVSSLLGSDPQWILVGKPGLGANHAYGWSYENYDIDPSRVAHLNLGLPIYGNQHNYFEFDGVDNFIVIDGAPAGVSPVTMCGWFKKNSTNSAEYIINQFQSTGTSWGIRADSTSISIFNDTSEVSNLTHFGTTISKNEWTHFAGGHKDDGFFLYINGELVGEGIDEGEGPSSVGGNLFIGQRGNNSSYFNGNISNVQVYNRALSPEEIRQNYNALKGRYGL